MYAHDRASAVRVSQLIGVHYIRKFSPIIIIIIVDVVIIIVIIYFYFFIFF